MQISWWDSVSRGAAGGGLGQRIVDVLAPTVRQNINLMNSEGIIVASTDPERLGTRHWGALEVLETGRPVVVPRPVEGIPDRPGINLPLTIDGEVTGVVGVTGDPAEVEPLAQVVVLTVELLIEQEREHRSSIATRSRAREIIAGLASKAQPSRVVHELLAAAGLGEGPWTLGVWAAVTPRQDGSAAPPERAEQLVADINDGRPGPVRGPALSVVWHGLLWVIAPGVVDDALAGDQARRLVVTGVTRLSELRSWAQDMAALGRSVHLLPRGDGRSGPPVELTIAAAHLPPLTLERMAAVAARLSTPQREAVRVLAGASSTAEAARRLYLHRNTLLQRVARIRSLTGLDPRRTEEAAALRLAILAREARDGQAGR